MPTAPKRVLCVDDDEDTCNMLEVFLSHAGYKTVLAYNADDCLRLVQNEVFDLFLLDLWVKDTEEFELCRKIREIDRQTPIVIYSADARINTRQKLAGLNIQAFLVKPQGLDELVETIRHLVE